MLEWCGRDICERRASRIGYETHLRLGERPCLSSRDGLREAREAIKATPPGDRVVLDGANITELHQLRNDHYADKRKLPKSTLAEVQKRINAHYRAVGRVRALEERTDLERAFPENEKQLRHMLQSYSGYIMSSHYERRPLD